MNSLKNEKQKKFLLVLPLIAIPFCTLLFWSLGGGKSAEAQDRKSALTGLNMMMPGAKLKNDSTANKLSIYEQAEKDSLKFRQERKDDPYYHDDSETKRLTGDSLNRHDSGMIPPTYNYVSGGFSQHGLSGKGTLTENEKQINLKLAEINRQINQPSTATIPSESAQGSTYDTQTRHLQSAVQKMNTSPADPEMEQLSGMLDKIADIQNPGIARQKMKEQSEKNRGQVFAISGSHKENPVTSLSGASSSLAGNLTGNGFYSLDDPTTQIDSQNTVEAVVATNQTLVNGATVKLRLVNDIFINGVLIPQNTFVFGTAELSGERLGIKIGSIRYQKSLFPVSLSVFDMDGLDGIYIPGAITRDVAKESADQSIQNLGLTSYDPSLGAQAASAGITAAKTLFSRKVRLIKVTVKAGYQVLLRDEKQKQLNQ